MRTTLIPALLLLLIAAPAAQAQQTTAPAPIERATLPVVEAPLPAPEADTARVTVGMVQLNDEVEDVAARQEMSARTLLAIVGGVVVVIGLIVLLR